MMEDVKKINTNTLRSWLAEGKEVSILDIRPIHERAQSFIPSSIHVDVYNKLKTNNLSAFDGLHLDKSIPVVTFCAGGKTSLLAAEMLTQKGYNAYSLEGGLNAWNKKATSC